MRAEVRLRWSQEVIAGQKLIRGGMETEPGDNSSISFRQGAGKIAQRCACKGTFRFYRDSDIVVGAMKMHFSENAKRGLTLIEALVVIACVAILIAMILPSMGGSSRPTGPRCMNNQKQVAIGFLIYAEDNHGKLPFSIPVSSGGTRDYLDRNQTFPHYQKLTYDTNLSRFLVCPADKQRKPTASLQTLTDANISYFLNADISTNNPAQSILSGDRDLQADGKPAHHGTLLLNTNMDIAWTPELHAGRGLVGFVDGHVEFSQSSHLNFLIVRQGLSAFHLSVP